MDTYHNPPSMTLSPQSQTQSPAATPFRPRRSEDWNDFRDVIEQLYRSDQLKLRDVKRIMERDYSFYASEKQYKDRLAAWNVRKNIKASEVQVMIRKKQKRAARGKQTAFRRAGQNVDPKRITRFVRRYGSNWVNKRDKEAELQSPEPTAGTPSDMSCYTPEPEEEAATPISPPDLQSPSRETPYPLYGKQNHLDSIPDLVMDDDHSFPMSLQSHQRRVYHPSDPVAHSIAHQGVHVTHPGIHMASHPTIQANVHASVPPPMLRAVHPGPPPMIHPSIHQPLHSSVHHAVHHSVRSTGHPVVTQIAVPAPITSHHDDVDAPGEVTHPDDWNRLDVFQNRLNRLGSTLEESMAKWSSSRDQDPNQEVPHHEGLGL